MVTGEEDCIDRIFQSALAGLDCGTTVAYVQPGVILSARTEASPRVETKNLSGSPIDHTHDPNWRENVERRADMHLSTLRSVIEGMGGELDVRAVFPDGSVRIKKLKAIKKRA